MKYIAINIFLVFVLFCGGGKKDNAEPIKKKPQAVYYLENDLNTHFNLHGPVHTLSKMFMRNDTDSFFINVLGLPSYPLTELGYRGFWEFDTLGLSNQNFGYKDSLDFVNNTKATIGSLYFYRRDSLPLNIDYKTIYSRNIIYPGMLKLTQAFETVSANIPNEEVNIDTDSLYYRAYFYRLEEGKIKYRLQRDILYSGFESLLPYYDERVEYIYDSLNRVIRENYSYYEKVDPSDPNPIMFKDSHEYHHIKVGSRDTMHKTYTYDDKGRIVQVVMYINGNYRFEEKYNYDNNGDLISKIQIDPRWKSSMMRHRSYRTVYHYDEYGNIIRLDMHNKEKELQEQLWVDYYDFDRHNNWQRCEMFLNHTHEGEPTLTGYRNITYYE